MDKQKAGDAIRKQLEGTPVAKVADKVGRGMRREMEQIKKKVMKTLRQNAVRYAKDVLRKNPTFDEKLVKYEVIPDTDNCNYRLLYMHNGSEVLLGEMRYTHKVRQAGFVFIQNNAR